MAELVVPDEFVTETGCTVRVGPHFSLDRGLTEGTLLILRMDQPGDGRTAELLMTPQERRRLAKMLTTVTMEGEPENG